jgi:hypothetical protein
MTSTSSLSGDYVGSGDYDTYLSDTESDVWPIRELDGKSRCC